MFGLVSPTKSPFFSLQPSWLVNCNGKTERTTFGRRGNSKLNFVTRLFLIGAVLLVHANVRRRSCGRQRSSRLRCFYETDQTWQSRRLISFRFHHALLSITFVSSIVLVWVSSRNKLVLHWTHSSQSIDQRNQVVFHTRSVILIDLGRTILLQDTIEMPWLVDRHANDVEGVQPRRPMTKTSW